MDSRDDRELLGPHHRHTGPLSTLFCQLLVCADWENLRVFIQSKLSLPKKERNPLLCFHRRQRERDSAALRQMEKQDRLQSLWRTQPAPIDAPAHPAPRVFRPLEPSESVERCCFCVLTHSWEHRPSQRAGNPGCQCQSLMPMTHGPGGGMPALQSTLCVACSLGASATPVMGKGDGVKGADGSGGESLPGGVEG